MSEVANGVVKLSIAHSAYMHSVPPSVRVLNASNTLLYNAPNGVLELNASYSNIHICPPSVIELTAIGSKITKIPVGVVKLDVSDCPNTVLFLSATENCGIRKVSLN